MGCGRKELQPVSRDFLAGASDHHRAIDREVLPDIKAVAGMCSGDEYACRQFQQRFAMHAGLEVLQKTVVQQAMDAGGHQGVLQQK
jgi:hypothetical protein